MHTIDHWIDGKLQPSTSGNYAPVFNPATGVQESQVGLASSDEVQLAVASAKKAAKSWRAASISKRAEIMFRFRELVVENRDAIANLVSKEHGKVPSDAAVAAINGPLKEMKMTATPRAIRSPGGGGRSDSRAADSSIDGETMERSLPYSIAIVPAEACGSVSTHALIQPRWE